MSKTYAPRSRALAADIALQAAVDEAVGLLRRARIQWSKTVTSQTVTIAYHGTTDWRGDRVEVALAEAERQLLAAATTAELILGSES